jgi:periplasmic nitrate reductase NapD
MQAPPPSEQVHIASLVVHALPQHAMAVIAAITTLPCAQVHAVSVEGKLVVTLEADTDATMLDQIAVIQQLDGVLTAALVYQCADRREAMDEEVAHDDPAT